MGLNRGANVKAMRGVQNALIASKRLEGSSLAEIAKLFKLSPTTVSKRLEEAHKDQLIELAKCIITERFTPKALAILDQELDAGNYEAAKDVLYGNQILQKGGKATITHVASGVAALDAIRKEIIDVTPIHPSGGDKKEE